MAPHTNVIGSIPVVFMKEGKKTIAFSPALDIATFGKTMPEARRNFEEAISLYLEELTERGMFDEALRELGWKKIDAEWQSPVKITKVVSISLPLKKEARA